MSTLNREVQNVQNPALGSLLIWRFCCSYAESSNTNEPVPLPLAFVVLPILLHEETRNILKSTQKASGLRLFVDKFTQADKLDNSNILRRDYVLSIQNRAIAMRSLTLQSISIGISSKLVALDADSGLLVPLSYTKAKRNPNSVLELVKCAEKLGVWFSELSLHEISTILKVRF